MINKKLKECQDWAISKNGLCLSYEYKNCKEKMLWKCENGHIWEAIWDSVKNQKTWCQKCAYDIINVNRKLDILELQRFAISKNGILLSTIYKNSKTKMLWQCEKNINLNQIGIMLKVVIAGVLYALKTQCHI